jgi:hypothetical protein
MRRIEPFDVNPFLMFIQRSVVNPVMIPLLRWFGSSELMLLTYVGPKSGRRVTIPLGYRREGDVIASFTPFGWWRNLSGGREVTLSIRRQELRGIAEPVTDLATVSEELTRYLEGNLGDARFFKIRIGPDHHPDLADVASVAPHVVMIRIHLQSPADAVSPLQR